MTMRWPDKQSDGIVEDKRSLWREVKLALYFLIYIICCRLGMVKLLLGVVRVRAKLRNRLFRLIHR